MLNVIILNTIGASDEVIAKIKEDYSLIDKDYHFQFNEVSDLFLLDKMVFDAVIFVVDEKCLLSKEHYYFWCNLVESRCFINAYSVKEEQIYSIYTYFFVRVINPNDEKLFAKILKINYSNEVHHYF